MDVNAIEEKGGLGERNYSLMRLSAYKIVLTRRSSECSFDLRKKSMSIPLFALNPTVDQSADIVSRR